MAKYTGPIIDVDVHHGWKKAADVIAYLPERWQQYVNANPRAPMPITPVTQSHGGLAPGIGQKMDAYPADGSAPGTDRDLLKEQLVDAYNYWRLVLTFNLGGQPLLNNPYFAAAVCRAANEWTIEQWLSRDDRFYGVILVPLGLPEEAANEIRRIGAHPKVVSVLLGPSPLGMPFGHPVYHPVYEAAAEMGLSLAMHPGPAQGSHKNQMVPVGGAMESLVSYPGIAMHYISSFITHGVFEKWPGLKLMVKEYALSWLPSMIWRLDANYDILRTESPWVKRLPSDYIREHVSFSTQPIEEGPRRGDFFQVLESVDWLPNNICFSSDYPHMTGDDPAYVSRLLPDHWASKVFCENACRFYGWTAPEMPAREKELVA